LIFSFCTSNRGIKALDDVSLTYIPGEIHALLGENGAWKSILINIICGIYPQYEGTVSLNDSVLHLKSYQDALEKGISIVNQGNQTIPDSSVAENIMPDKLERFQKKGRLDWKKLEEATCEYIDMVHLDLNVDHKVGPLSAAQKQLIQRAKALASETPVLLLDEPTSSLTKKETDNFFTLMNELRDGGKTLIFVSHKLEEIFALCDKISVIRDGQWVATKKIDELNRTQLIEMMIGRKCSDEYLGELYPDKETVVLEVKNLFLEGKVDNSSFQQKR
jgi:ribose transport system ATP-binding protein